MTDRETSIEPMAQALKDAVAEIERLRAHGPQVQRGTSDDGTPWMGTMREAWEDAVQAARHESDCAEAYKAEADSLRAQLAERDLELAQLAERDRDAEQLHEALREAMYQATEYDGLDLATIGPQHWYTKAAAIDAAMATPKD